MTNKITAITSRQAVMEGYIPALDNIINNFTVVYNHPDQGLIRLLLKLINELGKQNKVMFISLLNKNDEIIKRSQGYSDINLTLDNVYIMDNPKINTEEIISALKDKEIKVLVIDSFDLLDENETDKKAVLESLYNLKNKGITVITGIVLNKTSKDLINYIKDLGNVIMIEGVYKNEIIWK